MQQLARSAESFVERAPADTKTSAKAKLAEGGALMAQDNFDGAIAAFDEAVELSRRDGFEHQDNVKVMRGHKDSIKELEQKIEFTKAEAAPKAKTPEQIAAEAAKKAEELNEQLIELLQLIDLQRQVQKKAEPRRIFVQKRFTDEEGASARVEFSDDPEERRARLDDERDAGERTAASAERLAALGPAASAPPGALGLVFARAEEAEAAGAPVHEAGGKKSHRRLRKRTTLKGGKRKRRRTRRRR